MDQDEAPFLDALPGITARTAMASPHLATARSSRRRAHPGPCSAKVRSAPTCSQPPDWTTAPLRDACGPEQRNSWPTPSEPYTRCFRPVGARRGPRGDRR